MIILQIFIGLFAAVGIGCILADLMKVPTMKASKAANNLGKKGDKKTSIIEIYLKEFATKLSEKIKLNEYKKAQLEADLRTAGMDISPELYVSNAIVKSVAIGLLAIPAFLIVKILGLFIVFVAIVVYFSESKKVTKMITAKRKKIEYELPRLVGSIEKTMKHQKGAIYALEAFKDTTCPELKEELEITIADMRSGNEEVALTRLESRVLYPVESTSASNKSADTSNAFAMVMNVSSLGTFSPRSIIRIGNAKSYSFGKILLPPTFCFSVFSYPFSDR